MSTVGIEIGELNVHSFVRKDTYGLFYTGAERSSQKPLLILALTPFEKRPISLEKLTRSLSSTQLVEDQSLAKIMSLMNALLNKVKRCWVSRERQMLI